MLSVKVLLYIMILLVYTGRLLHTMHLKTHRRYSGTVATVM